MSLTNYKLTDAAIAQNGVVAAPDKLTGTAEQNKMIFDRLIRETIKGLFNNLIDALAGEYGAAEIGTSAIGGVVGDDVQTVLGSLKTILDTKAASADTTAALSLKSDKAATDLHFKSVSLNASTGVFTFTREDGSYVTIDTVLEKVATNWQYNAATQSLVLTLADGTTQSVPLSAFITETEFQDSAQIDFSVSNHKVTATVKAGSITDTMLSSALIAQLQSYVTASADSATSAAQSASAAEGYKNTAAEKAADAATSEQNAAASETAAAGSASTAASSASSASGSAALSESWAVGGTGTRTGEDTDNAKYWSQQAQHAAGGGVTSFNNRSGVVLPQSGDYTPQMLGLEKSSADINSLLGMVSAANAVANGGVAPGGFGLGLWWGMKEISNTDDLNNYTNTGWFKISGHPTNCPISGQATLMVIGKSSDETNQLLFSTGSDAMLKRRRYGSWKDWEWVNPPLDAGTEYRTTERYAGRPVYVIRFANLRTPATAGERKKTPHGIANIDRVIRCNACLTGAGGLALPAILPQEGTTTPVLYTTVTANSTNIVIYNSHPSHTDVGVEVVLYFIKSS